MFELGQRLRSDLTSTFSRCCSGSKTLQPPMRFHIGDEGAQLTKRLAISRKMEGDLRGHQDFLGGAQNSPKSTIFPHRRFRSLNERCAMLAAPWNSRAQQPPQR